jgi:type IV pilus assembly protein PilB
MLGEIRDAETAKMAIRAALTGHLVLSTIHTNSAWGTISRLLDMGVPSFLLANTLNVSVAQRLIRKLCSCKIEEKINSNDLPVGFEKEESFISYKAVGCSKCHFTGYKGRQALYEVIPIDKTMALAVKEEKFNVDKLLTERNIKSLSSLAFNCLKSGITSLEEIYPILSE